MKKLIVLVLLVGMLISVGCRDEKGIARKKRQGEYRLQKWKQEQQEQQQWEQEVELLGQRLKREREERMRIKAKADVKPKHEVILEECFGSLASIQSAIPEVRWIEFDNNYVHIGFNPIPSDVRTILGGHAFAGWQAINFGCHIYAYDASKYDSRKYGASSFAGATCRYGKTKLY